MIKRILACVVTLSMLLSFCVINVSAQEATVTMQFTNEVLRVGNSDVLMISVPEDIVKMEAYLSDNGKLSMDRSNMKYDSVLGKYKVTIDVNDGYCQIAVTAKYVGSAVVEFSDIVLYTVDSQMSAAKASAQIQIKPKATEIYTKEDLNNIRNNLSGNYVLMNDIVFSEEDFAQDGAFYNDGYGWQTIGSSLSAAFSGSFDGNGYAIKGLKVFKADYNYIGLFGVNRGTVENVALVDIDIDATVGVFVPVISGSGSSSGNINYESKDVWTPPTGSVDDGDLSDYDRTGYSSAIAGGVVAYNVGTVSDCYVSGNVFATPVAGGIVGSNVKTVERCYANANVSAKTTGVVVGYNVNHGAINDCHSKGEARGTVYAGGICGENRSSQINNSYSLANVVAVENGTAAAVTNGEYYSTVKNAYFLGGTELTDPSASALSEEEFAELEFSNNCWDYSTDFPVLKKLSSYILNEAEKCEHSETKEVIIKEATCTEVGSKDIVCTVCDEVLETKDIEALGHGATDEVVTKEATCTEVGSKDIVCTVCDEVLETVEIKATGHNWQPDVENNVAPTCTESGKLAYKCACGEAKYEEGAAALNHPEEEREEVVTKEAEIGVAGSKDIVCGLCDTVLDTVEIPALEPEALRGDVNGDGEVDAADLALIKKVIAKLTPMDNEEVVNPNVDADAEGLVDAADLALLKKIIAKLV